MDDYLKGGEYLAPRTIHADRGARELRIEWGDGHRSVFEFTALRWLCPCAFCRGEAGQPGWLDSNPTLTDEQVTLSDVSLVGHYALQPMVGRRAQHRLLHLRAPPRAVPLCGGQGPAPAAIRRRGGPAAPARLMAGRSATLLHARPVRISVEPC